MAQTYIGSSVLRKEDLRFMMGKARYVDDVKLPHMVHSAILRSPHAHARVLSIDASAALEMEGVAAVYTYQDVVQAVAPRPIPMRRGAYSGLERFLQYPLAGEKVRYVGEPVAVVVAESRYLAEDALDAIEVEYEPLPAIVDVWGSMKGDVLLFEEHGTNLALEYEGSLGDADSVFAEADYTRKEEFRCHRHTGNPLETRGLVASYDPGTGDLTVWGETKVPHFNRGVLASLLEIPEHRIHFVEPDVGGGFGIRGEFYPENFIVPFCSMKLGRPVKWIEDRMEHLIAANHSREHVCQLEIAATNDGVILGMRAEIYGALGGYVRTHGASVPISVGAMLMGPYQIPNYRWRVQSLLTNKVGMGTFSAPGRYESCFFRERILDMVAADLGIDPTELRSKNLIPSSAMPYEVGVTRPDSSPMVYDSGDYQAVLDKALELIDYAEIISLGGQLKDGKYHGVGVACFVKSTGGGQPYEGARIVVSGEDQVAVYLGIATMGQGHETSMAQICAEGLGVPIEYVAVYHGSTDLMPYGGGTHASRGTIMAGNAVFKAALELREKILGISAAYLDVATDELEFSAGKVKGKSDSGGEPRLDLGQDVTSYFRSDEECFPCGAHAVHLTVDPETGKIEIERYVVAEDVGHVINPMILTGQLVGATAQGIGATILEELVYDEGGQPLAGSLMDYLLPTSRDIPSIESEVVDLAPSPLNPLGVKGAGEIGIVATGAALSNAVSQALSSLGGQVRELPLSPDRLVELIREGNIAR